ncbi:DUF695 domain-containing protein [Patescibacteria group bacterium]|nr:DUF695 domain-containing protein [Patescibacteria group bacterium]
MFNLFKNTPKTYKSLSEYPESWSILQENNQGFIVRLNAGYKEAIGNPEYPIKMGIAILIEGEHDESIATLKHSVEDAISELLNKDEGALVAVITGMKEPKFIEFLSYTKNNLDFATIHKTLKDKFPKIEVQMHASGDPEWVDYQSFLK